MSSDYCYCIPCCVRPTQLHNNETHAQYSSHYVRGLLGDWTANVYLTISFLVLVQSAD